MKGSFLFMIFITILLFIMPFLSVLLFSLALLNRNMNYVESKSDRNIIFVYMFFCSLMLGLVNITKIPENDLIWYMAHYHEASGRDLYSFMKDSLTTSASGYWKEPCYSAYVWFLNRMTFDSGAAFKCLLTITNYMVLCYSVYLFGKKFELSSKCLIVGIVSMCFIPYIFTMSMHLLRQFLCNSVLILLAVRVCFYNKKDYWLMAMMPLFHSTGFLFLPLLLIPAFDKPIKDAKVWYLGLLLSFVGLQIVASYFGEFVGEDNSVAYALDRASRDTTKEFGGILGLPKIIMVILFATMSLYVSFRSCLREINGVKRFSNIIFFLALFVILNLHQQELAVRLFFFFFPFTPFLILYGIKLKPSFLRYSYIYVLVMFFFFSQFLVDGTWTYKMSNVFCSTISSFHEPETVGYFY